MSDPIGRRWPRLVDVGDIDTVATDEGDLVSIFLAGDNLNIIGTPTELLAFSHGIVSQVEGILRERDVRGSHTPAFQG